MRNEYTADGLQIILKGSKFNFSKLHPVQYEYLTAQRSLKIFRIFWQDVSKLNSGDNNYKGKEMKNMLEQAKKAQKEVRWLALLFL